MCKYKVWHISERVWIRYDLSSFALPLLITYFWNPIYNKKELQVQVLCFAIRVQEKGEEE